jgi:DNA-directed RNA polymerase subunit RPC12/RpoP
MVAKIFRYSCSACQNTIFFPEKHDLASAKQEIVCQNCDRCYQIQYWQIVEGQTQQKSESVQKIGRTETIDLTYYQLKVTNSDRRKIEPLVFTIPTRENFQVYSGNSIVTIFIKNNPNMLGIIDLEGEQTHSFYSLIRSAVDRASFYGISSFIIFVIISFFFKISLSLLLWLVPVIAILAGYSRWRESKETDLKKLPRLRHEQTLLQQMAKLDNRLEQLEEDRHQETRFLERLKKIVAEMSDLDREAYGHQIETYNRGISVLQGQAKLTEDLVDRCQKILSMLSIDYNTSQVEASLPDLNLNSASISAKINELDLLEKKREEMIAEVALIKILR